MRVLFLCTKNICRSILAEAIARNVAGERLQVASAGTHPAKSVHPMVVEQLRRRGFDTAGLRCKSLQDMADFKPRAIITLSDTAIDEASPAELGEAVWVHWPLPDPTKLKGSTAMTSDAFDATIELLSHRIAALLRYDLDNIDDAELKACLNNISTE